MLITEEDDCRELALILKRYERASGQKINLEKSSVYISPNVTPERQLSLTEALGIFYFMKDERYLDLPLVLGSSTNASLDSEAVVSSLIDFDTRIWKECMIRNEFPPVEAEKILQIPLCSALPTNRLIWNGNPSGLFTVKSSYHLQHSFGRRDVCSEPIDLWKKLWNSATTPRSRMLVWRVYRKALPLRVYLRRRGFYIEEGCGICITEPVNRVHVFRDCKLAVDVWNLVPFGKLILGPSLSDLISWLKYIAWILKDQEWNWFIFCLWDLWNQRNALLRGESSRTTQETMNFVNNYTEEFRRSQSLSRGIHGRRLSPPARLCPKWKPPRAGCLKINCDSSLDLYTGRAGVGVIIRD